MKDPDKMSERELRNEVKAYRGRGGRLDRCETVTVRLTTSLKLRMQEAALERSMTMSAYIEQAIRQRVANNR